MILEFSFGETFVRQAATDNREQIGAAGGARHHIDWNAAREACELAMIGATIAFVLRNLPALLLVLALGLAAVGQPRSASRFLAWVLLLPIGVTGLWAGTAHIAFPAMAARYIGWAPSPFQFEVGMADLAVGATACIAFWRPWEFRAAAVAAASIFLLGDAIGHVAQMVAAGNFAPGNAGVPFYTDVICPLLAITLLVRSHREAYDGRLHPRPTGPATDAVAQMDAAIAEHRNSRKPKDGTAPVR